MHERDPKDEALFRNVVAGLVASALVAFGLLVLLYIWQFGRQGLSPTQDHWGQFGDYLGGTLNPLLGFTSVVLLALTLSEQRKMLAETRRRAVLEELQRLLSARSQRLDEALAVRFDAYGTALEFLDTSQVGIPRRPRGSFSSEDKTKSVQTHIQRALVVILTGRSTEAQTQLLAYYLPVRAALMHLHNLDQCLSEFLSRGGDPVIGRLYGSQYSTVAKLLYVLDRLAIYPPELLDFPAEAARRMGLERFVETSERALVESLTKWEAESKAEADVPNPPNPT